MTDFDLGVVKSSSTFNEFYFWAEKWQMLLAERVDANFTQNFLNEEGWRIFKEIQIFSISLILHKFSGVGTCGSNPEKNSRI